MNYQYFDSPIGALRLVSNGEQLIKIEFEGQYTEDGGTETGDPILAA